MDSRDNSAQSGSQSPRYPLLKGNVGSGNEIELRRMASTLRMRGTTISPEQ